MRVFTPVLRSTGERIEIENPVFSEGFGPERGLGRKGTVTDPKTGKTYRISGKACGLGCQCDAWAVEVKAQ